jgi:purine-binding chemotaxis protein CheW
MLQSDAIALSVAQEMTDPEMAEARTQRMMLLAAGDHLFALPLNAVLEIMPARPYTALPGAGRSVCGLVNVRGRIITVIDLAAHLKLPPASADPDHNVVILEHGQRHIGFAIGEIQRILHVDQDALDSSADALRALGFDRDYVQGVGEFEERLFVALDPREILRPLFT